jgi:hypothetical protein
MLRFVSLTLLISAGNDFPARFFWVAKNSIGDIAAKAADRNCTARADAAQFVGIIHSR